MCGIIGVVGKTDVVPSLIEGLKRLEYRGYDSAGIATLVNDSIERRRSEGKIARLEERVAGNGIHGDIGIGHTRWATHGVPNERNAHPHATDKVALVHNGIIENYRELAAELSALGHVFASETDSEIAAHLITRYLNEGMTPQQAVSTAIKRMDGAYALAILFKGEHDLIVGARKGSPLAVGWGEGEMFLGSDALALSPFARRISYLEEGDWVELSRAGAIFHDEQDRVVDRPAKPTAQSGAMIGKGNYPHFMLKEIYEQPGVIGDTLRSMWNPASGAIDLPPLDIDLAAISRITLVACGTSYLGAMVAKYWFEKVARIAADIDIASEFRYRDTPLEEGGLAIFISQSGETIDTLAALRHAKAAGQKTIAIVNVPESTMAREADAVLPTLAGPEIGVASTKAFTCQLVLLACLVIATARARGAISGAEEARLSNAIAEVPSRAAEVLNGDEAIQALAAEVAEARDVLYIGRNTGYPIALEGALKLKEISYIHAEGYASGELKHGPIALIDEETPVVFVAPFDGLFDKSLSNLQEVAARRGEVILISDASGLRAAGEAPAHRIELPDCDPFTAPILYSVPVQLLAYHVAVEKGTDVDQPRNLAKSVTVE